MFASKFTGLLWLCFFRCFFVVLHPDVSLLFPQHVPDTLWLFNIAMENHHFKLIGKPSISMGHRKTMAMLVITRGYFQIFHPMVPWRTHHRTTPRGHPWPRWPLTCRVHPSPCAPRTWQRPLRRTSALGGAGLAPAMGGLHHETCFFLDRSQFCMCIYIYILAKLKTSLLWIC